MYSVVMRLLLTTQVRASSARSLTPKFMGLLRSSSSPPLLHSPISLLILTQIKGTMNSEQRNRRRVYRKSNSIDPPSPAASRTPKTMLDTLRRARLLADVRHIADKLSCIQLFKIHNVSKIIDY